MARCLVTDVMVPVDECVLVRLHDTIAHLKEFMRLKNHPTAIVLDEEQVAIGVITSTDITIADESDLVSDHWSEGAYTIEPDKPVAVAKKIMFEKKNKQLVIVDGSDRPLGIIWRLDAVLGCPKEDTDSN